MMGKRLILTLTFILIAAGINLVGSFSPEPVSAAPAGQSGELLVNPSFEEPYYRIATNEGGGAIASGWAAWWYNDPGPDYSVPEYEIAPAWRDPYRVRSGGAAQQIFRPSVLWKAGVYQRVQVPPNSKLRFTIYGHTWATFCELVTDRDGNTSHLCDPRDSNKGGANPAYMRIGIDPTGGENWQSPNIVWSPEYNIHDNYEQLAVEATAQGNVVTVYTYTTFLYPAVINNAYWDDASLTVIGTGNPPPAAPTTGSAPTQQAAAPPSGGNRVQPQPARPDGSQVHVVRAGETLAAIATAYGVSVQTIRDLNSISGDLIFVGQELLIVPPPPTPTPTPEPTATPAITPTAQEAAELPQTGTICATLFEDLNRNGLPDPDEAPLAGGQLTVTGGAVSVGHVTDGVSEPHCFPDLEPGDYTVSITLPERYALTTGGSQVLVTIVAGSQITLNFGAMAVQETVVEEEAKTALPPIGVLALIVGGIGLLLLLLGIGLAAYFLIIRKRISTK